MGFGIGGNGFQWVRAAVEIGVGCVTRSCVDCGEVMRGGLDGVPMGIVKQNEINDCVTPGSENKSILSSRIGQVAMCSHLQVVSLGQNKLNGTIPQQLLGLKLVQINVSHNSLTGFLPPDFGNLELLVALDLRHEWATSFSSMRSFAVASIFALKNSSILSPANA
ncbi:putative receptor-like protein kinase [Quercus suber]|uniref:Receptor-like protein kinase n=1 Tax=Quercus suber TaxID=58331 RepID=A0AAW0J2S3_QUESU